MNYDSYNYKFRLRLRLKLELQLGYNQNHHNKNNPHLYLDTVLGKRHSLYTNKLKLHHARGKMGRGKMARALYVCTKCL